MRSAHEAVAASLVAVRGERDAVLRARPEDEVERPDRGTERRPDYLIFALAITLPFRLEHIRIQLVARALSRSGANGEPRD